MIKLTVLVKRNPALSVEDFHAEWRAHGRMIAAEPVFARFIRRYEQHHRVPADYRNGALHNRVGRSLAPIGRRIGVRPLRCVEPLWLLRDARRVRERAHTPAGRVRR